jgi:repressor LexA
MGATTEILDDIGGRSAIPQELARDKNVFVLKVNGDSFIDEQIRDGDLILVETPSMAENGETVLALVDGEPTIKRLYRQDEEMRLQSTNEKVKPIVASKNRIEIRGLVVAVIRKYGN